MKKSLCEFDKNLLVVFAVEEYAYRHNISASQACEIFLLHSIPKLIRENYETLHTQDLSETANFAEDILERSQK